MWINKCIFSYGTLILWYQHPFRKISRAAQVTNLSLSYLSSGSDGISRPFVTVPPMMECYFKIFHD